MAGTWYEAKVVDERGEGAAREYLVHYNGWKARYDEWVGVGNEELTNLLGETLPIEALLGLANLEIPLPELGGILVDQADTSRDKSGVHTLVDIELR